MPESVFQTQLVLHSCVCSRVHNIGLTLNFFPLYLSPSFFFILIPCLHFSFLSLSPSPCLFSPMSLFLSPFLSFFHFYSLFHSLLFPFLSFSLCFSLPSPCIPHFSFLLCLPPPSSPSLFHSFSIFLSLWLDRSH